MVIALRCEPSRRAGGEPPPDSPERRFIREPPGLSSRPRVARIPRLPTPATPHPAATCSFVGLVTTPDELPTAAELSTASRSASPRISHVESALALRHARGHVAHLREALRNGGELRWMTSGPASRRFVDVC